MFEMMALLSRKESAAAVEKSLQIQEGRLNKYKARINFLLKYPFHLGCYQKVPTTMEVGLLTSIKAVRTVL